MTDLQKKIVYQLLNYSTYPFKDLVEILNMQHIVADEIGVSVQEVNAAIDQLMISEVLRCKKEEMI